MEKRDYRMEAEKLVFYCEKLENEYVKYFTTLKEKKSKGKSFIRELQMCEKISRALENADPDCMLQLGFTLPTAMSSKFHNLSLSERKKIQSEYREKLVGVAITLLKKGKLKPLKK